MASSRTVPKDVLRWIRAKPEVSGYDNQVRYWCAIPLRCRSSQVQNIYHLVSIQVSPQDRHSWKPCITMYLTNAEVEQAARK